MRSFLFFAVFFFGVGAFAQEIQPTSLVADVLKMPGVQLVVLKPESISGTLAIDGTKVYSRDVFYQGTHRYEDTDTSSRNFDNNSLGCTVSYRTEKSDHAMLHMEPGYDMSIQPGDVIPVVQDTGTGLGSGDRLDQGPGGLVEYFNITISGPYPVMEVDCDAVSAQASSPFVTVQDFENATGGLFTLK